MTLDDGLIMTWRLPLFSALYMLLSASFRTLTLTIVASACYKKNSLRSSGFAHKKSSKTNETNRNMQLETSFQCVPTQWDQNYTDSLVKSYSLTNYIINAINHHIGSLIPFPISSSVKHINQDSINIYCGLFKTHNLLNPIPEHLFLQK